MATASHRLAGVTMIVIAIAATGCARTTASSLVASDASGIHFGRIMVSVPFTDLGLRREAEDQFAKSYSGKGVMFVPSYQVLFPGRSYSQDEAQQVIRGDSIDGVLFITLNQAGTTAYRTPTTTSTQCAANDTYAQCASTTTGGYDIRKPWASFTAQLYDARTGRSIWIATENTRGNAFANSGTVVRSMANSTLKQLEKDGVIPE